MSNMYNEPVKCVECKVWWRGQTHKCDTTPPAAEKYKTPRSKGNEGWPAHPPHKGSGANYKKNYGPSNYWTINPDCDCWYCVTQRKHQ